MDVQAALEGYGASTARVGVGQVLQADNTPPKVSAKFYKAVVQSVLLYGSKSWNLITTTLTQLEESNIRAASRMAKKHKPLRGPNQVWVYPATSNGSKSAECIPLRIILTSGGRRFFDTW